MTSTIQQVQMIWPVERISDPPVFDLSTGYSIRTYQEGDEPKFYRLMTLAGWQGWDNQKLQPWLYRILPDGWYMIIYEDNHQIVATCMATHDPTWITPFCGELAWLAGDPKHSGKGLGFAVAAAVTSRFIHSGYRIIHLYTEPYRLAALKIYLKLGYIPLLESPDSHLLWHHICSQLDWPFRPDEWLLNPH